MLRVKRQLAKKRADQDQCYSCQEFDYTQNNCQRHQKYISSHTRLRRNRLICRLNFFILCSYSTNYMEIKVRKKIPHLLNLYKPNIRKDIDTLIKLRQY